MLYVAIAASIMLGATAGWAYTNRPSNHREHTTTFQLWSVSGSVLGPQTTTDVDGQRFVAGLRMEQAQLDPSQLRHAIVSALRPQAAQGAQAAQAEQGAQAAQQARGADSLANHPTSATPGDPSALARLAAQRGMCLVSVPRSVAANVAYAAAGCGLMAIAYNGTGRDEHTSSDSARNRESTVWINGIPDTWRIQPMPSWFLGLGSTGHPVSINLVPGATILLHGDQNHVNAALAGLPWDSAMYTVIQASGASPAQVRDQWEQAWDRTRMRVVIADPGALPEHFITASVELQPSGTSRSAIRSQGIEMFFDSQLRPQTASQPQTTSRPQTANQPSVSSRPQTASQPQTTSQSSVAPPPPDPPHPVPAAAGQPPASATGAPYPPIALR